jgi:predicted MPP superfamily phosphohydrolase
MYTSDTGDFPPLAHKHWRDAIEDLLYENNVDMYLSGHVHAYERLYPIYDGVVEAYNYSNPRGNEL